MHRIEHSSIDARIARVCDPKNAVRYSILYSNPHTKEVGLEMHNLLPGDVTRAREAMRGQGCFVHWSGMTSDFRNWARVPTGFKFA